MKNKNELKEIQKLLMKQMHRLDTAVGKEVSCEINRSGAMSQNAQAYLKSVATSLLEIHIPKEQNELKNKGNK